ncbi:urea carboxylase-associated protein 1 [Leclercia adecarboxylata]|uniref:Urea carboxylase-associated protein 1 n=1 Tax=Leclercia adecarboxylata TaxID=83655 RepID=A0A4U9HVW1_9ENTR|nr:urea carboxylase-associated protein 1 [Leclercia adecarboxylata]
MLYSNLGNPLLTLVADTCGRHDTLGGACAQESNTVRYALDKRHMHSCRDNFLCACLHDGRLHKRDIGANINFFMNVPVDPAGRADLCRRHLRAGEICRAARRVQRHRADLQLPAAEQPLQRLEPDACGGTGMELTPTRWQRLRQALYRLF